MTILRMNCTQLRCRILILKAQLHLHNGQNSQAKEALSTAFKTAHPNVLSSVPLYNTIADYWLARGKTLKHSYQEAQKVKKVAGVSLTDKCALGRARESSPQPMFLRTQNGTRRMRIGRPRS